MPEAVLTAGIVCVIAALIGGGLKAFGIELPLIDSRSKKWFVGLFGFALMALYLTVPQESKKEREATGNARITPEVPPDGASSDEMMDEMRRLIRLKVKQEANVADLGTQIKDLETDYDTLKNLYDRGEGTTEERERAKGKLQKAKVVLDNAKTARAEGVQGISYASNRIDVLQKRIAERR
ncbi:MAG: hypothetical protein NT159_09395 [Proteobacteria bacterium]|nr:hypothetical protein [Pseudomonadota bacterium]